MDELSKKLMELKSTTQELKQTTQREKTEVEQSHSDIASEFARVQVEVDGVVAGNLELKKETDRILKALKDDQVMSVAKIENQVGKIGNKQDNFEADIKSIKLNQKRTEKDVEAIKSGQKKAELDIELIKGQRKSEIQNPRNSIASPYDKKNVRIVFSSFIYGTNQMTVSLKNSTENFIVPATSELRPERY